MTDTDGREDVEAYVLNSKYRRHVLEHLAEVSRATPAGIAKSVGDPRPHVSRALAELRERGVVELRVPETRSVGRYYGLTGKGEAAWPEIRDRVRHVDWSVEEPSDPATREVVALATDAFDDRLRVVCLYDHGAVTVLYADPDVLSTYTDEVLERAMRTLIFDHSLDEIEMPNEECRSEVIHFTDFSLLRVRIEEGLRVSVSFERVGSASVPAFADAVASAFETSGSE